VSASFEKREAIFLGADMPKSSPAQIMDKKAIQRALTRIAHEVLEQNQSSRNLALVGIRSRGAFLAERLAKLIAQIDQSPVPLGFVDITLYRDDIQHKLEQPIIQKTELSFDLVEKIIVLVDDVLFTGRTVRAALDEIIDFGRPRAIQLAVLIDRGNRELPIRADYVGKAVETTLKQEVVVKLTEVDGEDSVSLIKLKRSGRDALKK
jgi:pyrimidine operon attenuation protein/uracil phosphoribosyltransferase